MPPETGVGVYIAATTRSGKSGKKSKGPIQVSLGWLQAKFQITRFSSHLISKCTKKKKTSRALVKCVSSWALAKIMYLPKVTTA